MKLFALVTLSYQQCDLIGGWIITFSEPIYSLSFPCDNQSLRPLPHPSPNIYLYDAQFVHFMYLSLSVGVGVGHDLVAKGKGLLQYIFDVPFNLTRMEILK
jgi:hypothetical protein